MPPSPHRPARPEVLAFLADVKEHPQDDGLRLIFADWLEENGDPLDQFRAELIRSQIEYFRQPPTSATRPEHGRRARALQQKHGNAWLGPLASWLAGWSYQRGLLSVSMTLAHLRSHALSALAGTEAWAWIDEVYITDAQDADMSRLGQVALLADVVSLGFQGGRLGPAGRRRWPRCRCCDGCTSSIWDRTRWAIAGWARWRPARTWRELRQIDLAGMGLLADGANYLANSAGLARLERLNLRGNRLGNDGAAALARTGQLTHLQNLDLHSNLIGDAGAAELARSAALAGVRELNLADNQIGPEGALTWPMPRIWTGSPAWCCGATRLGRTRPALRQRFGSRVHVSGGV